MLLLEVMEQGKWELAALSLALGVTQALSDLGEDALKGLRELLDGDDGRKG